MADSSSRFRTTVGGFHKGDVTAYIEKTATQHRLELLERDQMISTLQEENHSLQQQLNLLMMSTPVSPAPAEAAEEPKSEAAPMPAPEPVSVQPLETKDWTSLELQAYRRAEAVERNAYNRIRKLYQQMKGLCTDTMDEFLLTDSVVRQTFETMLQQADTLKEAYETLSTALTTSREKLAAMNELLPEYEAE